jgi:hypothetical protein
MVDSALFMSTYLAESALLLDNSRERFSLIEDYGQLQLESIQDRKLRRTKGV